MKISSSTKKLLILTAACVLAALLSVSSVLADGPGGYTWTAGDELRLDGSTTVYPIVAAALGVTGTGGTSTSGPFQSDGHAGLQAQVEQGGSGVGRYDANASTVDLGDASSFTAANQATYAALTATKIARDGICIVVNSDVTGLTNITPDQVLAIYDAYYATSPSGWNGGVTGASNPTTVVPNTTANGAPGIKDLAGNIVQPITNWDQIIPNFNEPIVPIGRIIGSGTRDALSNFTNMDETNAEPATIYYDNTTREDSNGELAAAVTDTPYSIGYVGIGYADQITGATVLTVNGIKATPQNVSTIVTPSTPQYPFSRYLYLLQNLSSTDSQVVANRANATAFIQYMLSPAGQNIVTEQDFVRLQPLEDINGDGTISVQDLSLLGLMWNHSTTAGNLTNPAADINGDGIVSVQDLSLLGLWWNITYGVYATGVSPSSNPTPNYLSISSIGANTTAGSSLAINGAGFTGATAVSFGATFATSIAATSFTISSDALITAVVPSGISGAVSIFVTAPGGTATSSSSFSY